MTARVLVMGASGRIGTYLRQFWADVALDAVWQFRTGAPADGLSWHPLDMRVPDIGPVDTVLCLSGVTSGPALDRNTDLALAALAAAHVLKARRVLLCSSVAVYGAGRGPHAESGPCHPANAYGASKLAMERAALDAADKLQVTCLRIGNVAGADALLGGLRSDTMPALDRFADGSAPRRAYIGPRTLAALLAQLVSMPGPLPAVINVAQPGLVGMDALLQAAGRAFVWRDAPAHALPELALDTTLLQTLCLVPPANAGALVAEWRLTRAAPGERPAS
jgi:nucleoside-diphosphate-sugar epimerase